MKFKINIKVWRGCIFINLDNNSKWDEKKLNPRLSGKIFEKYKIKEVDFIPLVIQERKLK